MRAGTRATVAAAMLTAAALAGCGQRDGGEGTARDGAAGGEHAAPEHDGANSQANDAGGDSGDGTDASGAAPREDADTVPGDELELAGEAELSAEEREYLTDRVPRGSDPAAVLDVGRETCDRLGYLARHDPNGAAAAVRDGELPGAEDAVTHLCPEHRDLLDPA